MLFSELSGKVLVNLENGEVIGDVGDADLLIDELTGKIDSILLPARNRMLSRNHEDAYLTIKWKDVKKIGPEIMVVEIDPGRNTLW